MKKITSSIKRRKAAHKRGTKRSDRIKSTQADKSKRRSHYLVAKANLHHKEAEARAEIEARRTAKIS